jgi:hypothetical protein
MLNNLHSLADELNRDRLARAERQRPARQLQSHRRNQAASQGLQAIRQAINQIEAIIENATKRQRQTAHPDGHTEHHPAETDTTPAETAPRPSVEASAAASSGASMGNIL